MKKIIVYFLALSLASNSNLYAQTGDTSLHASAVAVCNCLSNSKIENNSTPQQLQQVFLQCILTSAPDLVTRMMGNGQDNMKAAEETATNLALEMMKIGCPAFTKIATAMMGDGGTDTLQMNLPVTVPTVNESTQTIDGIVINVEERDFIYLTLKTTGGRELTFMYYKYVPGSDDWIKDPVSKLKNKNVTLTYTETEVYQPKYKQFMNIKEIKTLSVK